jgi:hypothetical protein
MECMYVNTQISRFSVALASSSCFFNADSSKFMLPSLEGPSLIVETSCMYECVRVYIYLHPWRDLPCLWKHPVCMYGCIYTYIQTETHKFTHTNTRALKNFTCVRVCICICVCIACAYTRNMAPTKFIQGTNLCIYIYMYVPIYIYINICLCIACAYTRNKRHLPSSFLM